MFIHERKSKPLRGAEDLAKRRGLNEQIPLRHHSPGPAGAHDLFLLEARAMPRSRLDLFALFARADEVIA
jgi:hypothetical protein